MNAVLRKVDREPVGWPSREIELSCPEWLLARWERYYGREAAEAIARAALAEPEKYHARRSAPGYRLAEPSCRCSASNAARSFSISAPRRATRPRRRSKRACARWLATSITAASRSCGAWARDLVVLDGRRPLPFARRFDRILVDAPCSGTGTLGRNPEIKWRLESADLEDLPRRQKALLTNARAALAPGGLLVYSHLFARTEENRDVVAEVPPDWLSRPSSAFPDAIPGTVSTPL